MLQKYKFILGISFILIAACKKSYLEAVSDKSLIIPTTLSDFQLLLDNETDLNGTPGLGTASTDDFYFTTSVWQSQQAIIKNSYVWANDVYEGIISLRDWNTGYQNIYYSNVVLQGLNKLDPQINQVDYNYIMAQALFKRAFSFFELSQIFCKPYNAPNAVKDLGLVLRNSSGIETKLSRSNLEVTYAFIVDDIRKAIDLFPVSLSVYQNRSSLCAAYGLLSRVYMSKREYLKALEYADSCLKKYSVLRNYNDLNSSLTNPFNPKVNNPEIIYSNNQLNYSIDVNGNVDSSLYKSYSSSDLRKTLFFNVTSNGVKFKGSYWGSTGTLFSGIATDEIYLSRAECYARNNELDKALEDINALLKARWKNTDTYTNITSSSASELIPIILKERRKELVFRSLRWMDLRRLNFEPNYQTTLSREVGNQVYKLEPNNSRYTFLIPQQEISQSGIEQNIR